MVTSLTSLIREFRRAPVRRLDWSDNSAQSTSERYVLFVLLPLWVVPGLLDWWWHKRTDIEHTAGLQESVVHCCMMTEVGVPILMGLLFEVNPLVLSIMAASTLIHYGTAVYDVRLAVHRREVLTGEQHTHSFLEVLPFMGLAFAVAMNGDTTRRLLTGKTRRGDWKLQIRKPRLPTPYLLTIGALVAAGIVLPYANEILRCLRTLNQPKHNTGFYKEASTGHPDERNC